MALVLVLVTACGATRSPDTELVPATASATSSPTLEQPIATSPPVEPSALPPATETQPPSHTSSIPTTPSETATPVAADVTSPVDSRSHETGALGITVVYDNTTFDSRLTADWGFGAWLEYAGHVVLFDTGAKGDLLLDNMAKLDLNPLDVEIVVLSHEHGDHTGGLDALLDTGARPVVYAPASFPPALKKRIGEQTELVEVKAAAEILPGMHTTGQMGDLVEQALVVETKAGTVVITGCAHPGILRIVRKARRMVEGEIALVLGGFHLGQTRAKAVETIIAGFRVEGVRQAAPAHCTGERAIAMFAEAYGENYVDAGAGRVILVGTTEAMYALPTEAPLPGTTKYAPLFEKATCKPSFPPGYDVECGYLVVPEDRNQPHGPTVRLHVAVFRSGNPEAAPDPVVHLVGGPGGSLLDTASFYLQAGGGRILENRDYVLFNQRGTRYAEPSLECPGQAKFGLELAEQQIPWREREAREIEFLLACQKHLLAEGVNLGAYNSVENAADVADLLRVLGYDQANLYGISYGTKLALEVMRDHPRSIRSVILDSVYPLQVDINEEIASSADRAFTTLFEGCATNAECNAQYPNLEQVFYETVDELNAKPGTVKIKGGTLDAWLDGDILMDAVFGTLYRTDALRWLPLMIYEASRGNYEPLHTPLEVMADRGGISWGMYHSMQCREETAFEDHERALESSAGLPPQVVEHFASPFAFILCASWKSGQAASMEDEPVHSDLPTLVLAGQYDPVTPPSWAQKAAETLSNSFYFEFPGVGHGVMRSNSCGLEIGLRFLDDPTAEPDGSCLKELTGPDFQ
jgi:metal-dependent hydrolase (beta-lactamase superfamily II)/pimeloyl-ACP methyl ester carboxylesterase